MHRICLSCDQQMPRLDFVPRVSKPDFRHLEGEFLLSENGDFVSRESLHGSADEDAYSPLATSTSVRSYNLIFYCEVNGGHNS